MAAHPVDEKLPALKTAASGLHHGAALYAGVVAPPVIVGAAAGLTGTDLTFLTGACLFTAGPRARPVPWKRARRSRRRAEPVRVGAYAGPGHAMRLARSSACSTASSRAWCE